MEELVVLVVIIFVFLLANWTGKLKGRDLQIHFLQEDIDSLRSDVIDLTHRLNALEKERAA